jgi:Protein of unknown function (DUF1091)
MEYKYGTIYRPVVSTPSVEFCELMSGKSNNPMFDLVIAVIKDSVPSLFHACPYKLSIIDVLLCSCHFNNRYNFQGSLAYRNITMANNKFFSIWPSGDYRVHFVISNDDDENILSLTFYMSVKSPDKNSF